MTFLRTGTALAPQILRGARDAAVGAYKPGADPLIRRVAQAVRNVAPEFGFPPQPTDRFVTAHSILSTGWFDDDLSRLHNGVFGVKAGRSWTGPVALMNTIEFYTPEEAARAQAIPGGQRGSFIRYADSPTRPAPPGKRRVLIVDAFRKYPALEEAIRDHFRVLTGTRRSDGSLRYAASVARLRAGSPDYMEQLGRDGWYTAGSGETQAAWASIVNGAKLRGILAAGGSDVASSGSGGGGGLALALGIGVLGGGLLLLARR